MEQEAIMIFSAELVGVDDSLNFSLGKTLDGMADEKLS